MEDCSQEVYSNPCICGQCRVASINGASKPRATGKSIGASAASRTFNVAARDGADYTTGNAGAMHQAGLPTTTSTLTLPDTQVTPSTSNAGLRIANSKACASSTPVSTSSTHRFGIFYEHRFGSYQQSTSTSELRLHTRVLGPEVMHTY
jgi:hypothetical protein